MISKEDAKERAKNLSNGIYNCAVFTEIVKDLVCDWTIEYSSKYLGREKVFIDQLAFSRNYPSYAYAFYEAKKFEKFLFVIITNPVDKSIWLDVMNTETGKTVTRDWNDSTGLQFDKNGFSYEVTLDEEKYLSKYKVEKKLRQKGIKNGWSVALLKDKVMYKDLDFETAYATYMSFGKNQLTDMITEDQCFIYGDFEVANDEK